MLSAERDGYEPQTTPRVRTFCSSLVKTFAFFWIGLKAVSVNGRGERQQILSKTTACANIQAGHTQVGKHTAEL